MRGTSLALTYSPSAKTGTLSIIDTTASNPNAAASLWRNPAAPAATMISTSPPTLLAASTVTPLSSASTVTTTTVDKATLLANTWIRDNTKQDIVYLDTLATQSAAPLATKSDTELAVTVPQNPAECTQLFGGAAVATSGKY